MPSSLHQPELSLRRKPAPRRDQHPATPTGKAVTHMVQVSSIVKSIGSSQIPPWKMYHSTLATPALFLFLRTLPGVRARSPKAGLSDCRLDPVIPDRERCMQRRHASCSGRCAPLPLFPALSSLLLRQSVSVAARVVRPFGHTHGICAVRVCSGSFGARSGPVKRSQNQNFMRTSNEATSTEAQSSSGR